MDTSLPTQISIETITHTTTPKRPRAQSPTNPPTQDPKPTSPLPTQPTQPTRDPTTILSIADIYNPRYQAFPNTVYLDHRARKQLRLHVLEFSTTHHKPHFYKAFICQLIANLQLNQPPEQLQDNWKSYLDRQGPKCVPFLPVPSNPAALPSTQQHRVPPRLSETIGRQPTPMLPSTSETQPS
jgi:hypothetical protein